jgi:hypothetical protein
MFLGSKARLMRKADNLAAIYEPIVLDNVVSLTLHNSIGLQGLLRDSFTFTLLLKWCQENMAKPTDNGPLPSHSYGGPQEGRFH